MDATPPPAADVLRRSRRRRRPSSAASASALRSLRLGAGLTQTDLAGDRFSKEYISQIERGKTRPTAETIALARRAARRRPRVPRQRRLRPTCATGSRRCSPGPRRCPSRTATTRRSRLFREARVDRRRRPARPSSRCGRSSGEGWALMQSGEAREAIDAAPGRTRRSPSGRSSPTSSGPTSSSGSAVCRYKLSSIATAVALLDEALALAERSGLPCDLLRARHPRLALALPPASARLRGRARGRRGGARARAGVRRPSRRRELVLPGFARRGADGPPGRWRATTRSRRRRIYAGARRRAQRRPHDAEPGRPAAPARQARAGDRAPERVVRARRRGRARSRTPRRPWEASPAVHLQLGDYDAADENARKALELLDGREDFLDEIGQSSSCWAGRCSSGVASTRPRSASGRPTPPSSRWRPSVTGRGCGSRWGISRSRRGDDREAARLYRNAAEALQVVRF